jgi:hypothetical protein
MEPNARSSLGWRSPNPNPKTKNPNETVNHFARIFFLVLYLGKIKNLNRLKEF